MKFSEQHIKNLSLSHIGQHSSSKTEFKKGQVPWNKGKKGYHIHSKEYLEKLSELMKGKNHPFYGKHHTEETKEKIRIAKTKIMKKEVFKKVKIKTGKFIKCEFCGKEFYAMKSLIGIRKYCSRFCKGKAQNEKMRGKLNSSLRKMNYGGWNKGVKMAPLSKETIEKRTKTIKRNKLKNGYRTKEHHRIRTSKEYLDWRNEIFKRDDYTCQLCQKRGVNLNAHHIEYFNKRLELRFDINNGITLCEECHGDIHHLLGWN